MLVRGRHGAAELMRPQALLLRLAQLLSAAIVGRKMCPRLLLMPLLRSRRPLLLLVQRPPLLHPRKRTTIDAAHLDKVIALPGASKPPMRTSKGGWSPSCVQRLLIFILLRVLRLPLPPLPLRRASVAPLPLLLHL
jgi:hypothetical protein